MKVFLFTFSVVCFVAFASCYKQIGSSEWNNYKAQHGKSYRTSIEESQRMKIWMASKASVDKHNKLYEQGKVSYRQALNKFSDLTATEKKRYTGLKMEKPTGDYQERISIKPLGPIADELDWRTKGAVTEVKDQLACGSCYAFSGVGAIEGQHFLKTGKLISLSEQQIVDCSQDFQDNGCDGGFMESVYKYVAQAGGLDTEDTYPYDADVENCHYNKDAAAATVQSYQTINDSEEDLMNAVAKLGPISVGIYATESLQAYGGGVYYEDNCDGQINHGVLVVGYGTDNDEDYWLVKNSWGTNWGEDGYVKMARNNNNMCSIASDATVPTGVGSKQAEKKLENSINAQSFIMNLVMTMSRKN
jgi:cathepsin L